METKVVNTKSRRWRGEALNYILDRKTKPECIAVTVNGKLRL